MTYQSVRRPAFTSTETPRRFAIDELDIGTLAVEVRTDEDEVVPAGTPGTVVAVWGEAEAFDIAFDEPFFGLATVGPEKLRDHRPREMLPYITWPAGFDVAPAKVTRYLLALDGPAPTRHGGGSRRDSQSTAPRN